MNIYKQMSQYDSGQLSESEQLEMFSEIIKTGIETPSHIDFAKIQLINGGVIGIDGEIKCHIAHCVWCVLMHYDTLL